MATKQLYSRVNIQLIYQLVQLNSTPSSPVNSRQTHSHWIVKNQISGGAECKQANKQTQNASLPTLSFRFIQIVVHAGMQTRDCEGP